MKETEKNALLLSLIDSLRSHNSWCGETHIQKTAYFLEALCDVPLEFRFVLYKHGPFSFDLRDRLTALRADGFLKLEVVKEGYGPRIRNTELCSLLQKRSRQVVAQYQSRISFVAEKLAGRGVADLERLSTALLVAREQGGSIEARAEKITELKPHVTPELALNAVHEVDQLQQECHTALA